MSNVLRFPARHPVMTLVVVALLGFYGLSPAPSLRDVACYAIGCPLSAESAQANVLPLLRQKFATAPLDRFGFTVEDTRLIHKQGNEYTGVANVKTRDGSVEQVPIDVMYDGKTVMYTISAGGVSALVGSVFAQTFKDALGQ
ncbi:hypothetical protein [Castellaniella sp. MT123]|uniref:hypothetical protein n=1 Tax=Castellaniella sp. MT123 TaxID=3140381 RepID=UPI0031F388F2